MLRIEPDKAHESAFDEKHPVLRVGGAKRALLNFGSWVFRTFTKPVSYREQAAAVTGGDQENPADAGMQVAHIPRSS